ncbi:MAG: hypothetical protein EBS84_19385 [Proteobacteria bacterium]|nr:hypothetical protein [Verrucomicrobiota bacterium]NBU11150.1 hypothetical protein [Pseudomonadota bacterium]
MVSELEELLSLDDEDEESLKLDDELLDGLLDDELLLESVLEELLEDGDESLELDDEKGESLELNEELLPTLLLESELDNELLPKSELEALLSLESEPSLELEPAELSLEDPVTGNKKAIDWGLLEAGVFGAKPFTARFVFPAFEASCPNSFLMSFFIAFQHGWQRRLIDGQSIGEGAHDPLRKTDDCGGKRAQNRLKKQLGAVRWAGF